MIKFAAIPAVMILLPFVICAHVIAVPRPVWAQVGRKRGAWLAVLAIPAALGAVLVLGGTMLGWVFILVADAAAGSYLGSVRPIISVARGVHELARGSRPDPLREWSLPVFAGVLGVVVLIVAIRHAR